MLLRAAAGACCYADIVDTHPFVVAACVRGHNANLHERLVIRGRRKRHIDRGNQRCGARRRCIGDVAAAYRSVIPRPSNTVLDVNLLHRIVR